MGEVLTREERKKQVMDETKDYIEQAYNEGKTYVDVSKDKLPVTETILKNSVEHNFNSVVEVCHELNIPEEKFVSESGLTRYYSRLLTKNDVDKFIKEIHIGYEKGRHGKHVSKELGNGSEFVAASKRFYGTWEMALYRNGITPRIIKSKGLIKEVSKDIIPIYKRTQSIQDTALEMNLSDETVRKCLTSSGVEIIDKSGWYRNEIPPIPKDEIDLFIKSIIGDSINKRYTSEGIIKDNPLEAFSIRKYYGNISNAFSASNLYILDKQVPKAWNKEVLINQIKMGYGLGKELNTEHISKGVGASAETYARRAFGSWRAAIEKAGIPYEEVSKDSETNMDCGREFEAVLGDVFTELGVKYKKEYHDIYKPDYVVGDQWYDAKLSEYTYAGRDRKGNTVIDNYEPYCDRLTLVFLIGNDGTDRMVTDKTRLVHVSHYVCRLDDVRRAHYNRRLDDIKRKISNRKQDATA